MTNITTVIFDIGNVLAGFNWKEHIESKGFSEDINEKLGNIMFKSPLWRERDRGDRTEDEYKKLFISQAPELEYEINKVFENIINLVDVYPFATSWVQSVKAQGKKVYLLSNYNNISFINDIPKFDFLNYVDGRVISYEIHKVKPEYEIYEALLLKYNIIPEEAIFLDDSKENIEAASLLGINTIHVISHEQAVNDLQKYGIY